MWAPGLSGRWPRANASRQFLCPESGSHRCDRPDSWGHANVTTTLTVYTHLFADDHIDAMAALDAMAAPKPNASNVIPLYG